MVEVTRSWSDLPARVTTAAIAIPAVLAILASPWTWAWGLLVTGAIAVAGWECMRLLVPGRPWPVLLAGSALASGASIALSAADPSRSFGMVSELSIGAACALCGVGIARVPARSPGRDGVGFTLLALVFTTLSLGVLLGQLALLRRDGGASWALLAVCLSWGSDAAAYAAGRALGGPPLAPAASPAKTVAGSIAGLLAAVVAAPIFVATGPPGLDPGRVVLVTTVAGVLSQAGDLVESALKRKSGVKDSGATIPGHGGMLDCVDGLCLVAPWCYFASQHILR